ncbi:MAG TPA: BMC domain-containing protein [Acidobacteriota bacterium]|jgi:microcompartment protein CcmL/EutN|nr:BMC domain-containing protein [Acidobacteriota bacterium]HRR57394.1 BMC domain-containing protein [Acidobacteriota bacterium]HRV09585.1 BMC domain-containing protein [Acidobacteriota bacterium]
MSQAVGLVELSSVAAGFAAADAMLKTADVQLLVCRSICSGKYMVIIGGEVAAVGAAVDVGSAVEPHALIDRTVIPNVHPTILPALAGTNQVETRNALGILEAFSVASLIEGADEAVKAANVELIEIRLAMALGGKAFATMTGETSAVQAALAAGAAKIGEKGLLVNSVLIPAPRPELFREHI